jgi:hypothetical protein
MGIEQDFPMSPNQLKALVIGLVAMTGVGVAFFGGYFPGIKPTLSGPSTVDVNGKPYFYTDLALPPPSFLANASSPAMAVFHNVSFALWFVDWDWAGGALVQGNGTEANGTSASFLIGSSPAHPSNESLFLSPDLEFGAYWPGLAQAGDSVELLVLD